MSTTETTELAAIEKAIADHVEREARKGPREPHPYVYASSRRKCRRRMVLECTKPGELPEFDADTLARFARGKRRELDITTDLQRAGQLSIPRFEFVGQQERVRVLDRKGRLIISGMIDGYIKWESGAVWPVEIKSLSAFSTDKVSTFEDLYQGRYTWANAHQLLCYQYSKNAPYGLFVMDRSGLPKLLKVDLEANLEAMEGFIQDATIVVDHVEAGTLPDFIDDPDECKRCPMFAVLCNPPMSYDGSAIVTDEEIIARVERESELKESAAEYKNLHEENSEYFKMRSEKGKPKIFIVGKHMVGVKFLKHTTVDIPKDVKAQYSTADPAGQCRVTLTKVDA